MSAGLISLTYGSTTVSFSNFTDTEFPRSYMAQANLEFSQIGTAYASGPARRQRQMWSMSVFVNLSEWQALETLFILWDSQRATGNNLAVVILGDSLTGSVKNHRVFFTEPPALSKISSGNNKTFIATFVLVEV